MDVKTVPVWDKPIPVPAEAIASVDDAILARLPKDTKVKGIYPSGSSYWSRGARIETSDALGNGLKYFAKIVCGYDGRMQSETEFLNMMHMHNVMPELVPRPVASGRLASFNDLHFILYAYHGFVNHVWPSVQALMPLVAELHRRTAWPGRKFGYDVTHFAGNKPFRWELADTWEGCFSGAMQRIWAYELRVQGPDEELEFLEHMMAEKVIPRLLRPLESDGRTITPVLVHGDLWEGNTAVDPETGRAMIFDATPTWAHHEYELGPMWPERHQFAGKQRREEYFKCMEPSEPKDEVEGRGLLYCSRFDSVASSLYPGKLATRNCMKDNMRKLYAKYGEGYEAWAARQKILADFRALGVGDDVPRPDPTFGTIWGETERESREGTEKTKTETE